jgi:hypothetical protein
MYQRPLSLVAHSERSGDRYDQASLWAEKALRNQPNSADAAQLLATSCALGDDLERAQRAMQRLATPFPGAAPTSRTCCIELLDTNPMPQIATDAAING